MENSVEVVEALRSGLQEFLQILPRAVLPGRIDGVGDVPDDLGELGLLFHHLLHPVDGVEDGGVVTAAELLADLRQRKLGPLTNNIHGHVTGGGDRLVLVLAPQGGAVQLE